MYPLLSLYATWAQDVNRFLANPGPVTFVQMCATTAGYELAVCVVIGFCCSLAKKNYWPTLIRWWLKWGLALPFTLVGYTIVGSIWLIRAARR
ncbi:TPA: hypothetical protein DEP34_02460 [Candidatus Uhrbacteria bacterium]|uniref:Uncharacterized protein n=2 Tax=Candidatus Uhriibacteriota TaxID=1752732 RepID=A0A0G1Q7V3_9BACT|nr:MAG: hypothetical protein UX45_C0008G0002 [Candidatus Uhrbacteria bacterium GW2011_GWF2_46_218]KKU41106.1 MAG: hypothetical protein UX57_C0006G0016 [Candidatus Uhrbacteria bacterium GW2011_GWE2_46_68]HCB19226.1 hypothetical protein [Candidatus Uhrbacteria bacterium]